MDIDAPPAAVWRVLLDFPRYHEWSSFLVDIAGMAEPGTRLRITVQLSPDGSRYVFTPTVLQVTRPFALRWLGRLWLPGLFDGEQGFLLEPLGGGRTRLRHGGEFNGFLALLLWRRITAVTAAGFLAFNQSLKRRVESLPGPPP